MQESGSLHQSELYFWKSTLESPIQSHPQPLGTGDLRPSIGTDVIVLPLQVLVGTTTGRDVAAYEKGCTAPCLKDSTHLPSRELDTRVLQDA